MDEKIIGVFGGGFKPPTKGHFDVVKDFLSKHPEVDEFIIYIGGKMRDDISQAQSLIIWDLYKKYLPIKVKIEASNQPIGDIYRLAKNNKDSKIYWILGVRQGNEEDEGDINQRSHSIEKYDNLVLIKSTSDNSISGTKARNSLKSGSEEKFNKFIPDELNKEEKKEVWDILTPQLDNYKPNEDTIKEYITKFGLDISEEIKGFLGESKQIGNLYHFTSLDNFKDIANANSLENVRSNALEKIRLAGRSSRGNYNKSQIDVSAKDRFSISTTRNKLFYTHSPLISGTPQVRIVLDGNKISEHFKIVPFNYFVSNLNRIKNPQYNESEELIITPTTRGISDLDKYVVSYDILLDMFLGKLYEVPFMFLFSLGPKVRFLYNEKEIKDPIQYFKSIKVIDSEADLHEEQSLKEYHNKETLNPSVWDGDKLKPELRKSLEAIGNEFYESLSTTLPLQDILLVGSSANYNWTEASDVDLHLLMDFEGVGDEELLKKYFNAKKREFNEKFSLEYEGHPIEVYVQDTKEPNAAQGVYSVKDDKWLKIPEKENIEVSDLEIDKKAQPIMNVIDHLEANPKTRPEHVAKLREKISQFRKAGLEKGGEYAVENLAFKKLRNNGYLEKLANLQTEKTKEKFGLNEGKQVGTVYHFTSLDNLFSIGYQDLLKSTRYGLKKADSFKKSISVTRDKNFSLVRRKNQEERYISSDEVCIVLDGDKLSNKYQFSPYDDRYNKFKKKVTAPEYGDEMEEKITGEVLEKNGGIKNIKDYIKEIILNPSLDEWLDYFIRIYDNSDSSSINMPSLLFDNMSEIYKTYKENPQPIIFKRRLYEIIIDNIEKLFPGIKISSRDKIGIREINDLNDESTRSAQPQSVAQYITISARDTTPKQIYDAYKTEIQLIKQLVQKCFEDLNLKNKPQIDLINDSAFTQEQKSFACYYPGENKIKVVIKDRNVADLLRSLSHEIYHSYQNENNLLSDDSGEDGDDIENQANAYAGKTMREFGREHPEVFTSLIKENLEEAKQVGTLYHFTNLYNVGKIILSNSLISSEYDLRDKKFYALSFTRSKNFWNDQGRTVSNSVRISLDGNKLSSKYSIEPFQDKSWSDKSPSGHNETPFEAEERITKDYQFKIKPLTDYVYSYDFNLNKILDKYYYDEGIVNSLKESSKSLNVRFIYNQKEVELEDIIKLYGEKYWEENDFEYMGSIEESLQFSNWKRPDIETLKREFHIEQELKGNKFWKSEDEFLEAAKNAKIITLTPQEDSKINYRTHTKSFDELHDLISGYASYPKYRNETTLKNLYKGFKNNSPMELPLVIDFGNKKRVFAGNTRLDVAFQSGILPKVLLIKSGGNINEDQKWQSFGGCVLKDKKVLLREPSNHYGGYVWTFPKGKIDAGETPEECALREVYEETGVTGKIISKIDKSFGGEYSDTYFYIMSSLEETGKWEFETQNIKFVDFDEGEKLINKTESETGKLRDLSLLNYLHDQNLIS